MVAINKLDFRMLILCFLLFFSLQATDITIHSIEIGQMFFLLFFLYHLVTKFKIHTIIFYYILLFSTLLVASFITDMHTIFYINLLNITLMKEPYLISLSRFVEMLACFSVVLYVLEVHNLYALKKLYFGNFIDLFFDLNVVLSLVFLIFYLLEIKGVFDSRFVYGDDRLRGLFVEGGPLGLYYAFLFSVGLVLRRNIITLIVFIAVVILAQSKAGLSYIALIIMINYLTFSVRSNFVRSIVLIFALLVTIVAVYYIGHNYVSEIMHINSILRIDRNDSSIDMGRIPGVFIGSEMVKQHPIFGIGLGNYSLLRNDPDYRGMFPAVTEWDLTGLGIFNLIIDSGIFGFFVFSLILFFYYKKLDETGKKLIIMFYFVFFFGVQIYFLYPWFGLALALLYRKRSVVNYYQ